MSESDDTSEIERPRSARRRPENERKVWAEHYPGGDLQIEVGHMEHTEELYLMPGEAEALREILGELEGDDTDHEHEVGDVLEKVDSSEWKITNRMIDVDTDEVLYSLREVHSAPGFTETEILTESQIARSFDTDGDSP